MNATHHNVEKVIQITNNNDLTKVVKLDFGLPSSF